MRHGCITIKRWEVSYGMRNQEKQGFLETPASELTVNKDA